MTDPLTTVQLNSTMNAARRRLRSISDLSKMAAGIAAMTAPAHLAARTGINTDSARRPDAHPTKAGAK